MADSGEGSSKGQMKPYQESDEELPQCAAYDIKLDEIKSEANDLVGVLQDRIQRDMSAFAGVDRMTEIAAALGTPRAPKKVVIGLLGHTGAGKSSLANSLIDIPGLARAVSGGESCTAVASKFCSADADQSKRFRVSVTFFDQASVRKMLDSALYDWSIGRNPDDSGEVSVEQRSDRARARAASDMFRSLLCKGSQHFGSAAATEATMNSLCAGEASDLLESLVDQVLLTVRTCTGYTGQGSPIAEHDCDSVAEVQTFLQPLVFADQSFANASLWSVARYIEIRVKGSRMLEGCSLLDLPGINDSNIYRKKLALKMIGLCDRLWLVAWLGRIVEDRVVEDCMRQYGKVYEGRITIIATRADDGLDESLAAFLMTRGQSLEEYTELQKVVATTEGSVRQSEQAAESVMSLQVMIDIRDGKRKVQELRSKAMGFLFNARIAVVRQAIQGRFFGETAALPVHCIANEAYRLCKTVARDDSPSLTPVNTGVPALRNYLHELASPVLIQAFEMHITRDLDKFFGSLSYWSSNAAFFRDVEEFLKAFTGRTQQALNEIEPAVMQTLQVELTAHVMPNLGRFSQESLTFINRDMNAMHGTTINKAVERPSEFKSPKFGDDPLDKQLGRSAQGELVFGMGKVRDQMMKILSDLEGQVKNDLNNVFEMVKTNPAIDLSDRKFFEIEVLGESAKVEDMLDACRTAATEVVRQMGLRVVDYPEGSYFGIVMEEVYRQCRRLKGGKEAKEQILQVLATEFYKNGNESVFAKVLALIQEDVVGLCRRVHRDVSSRFERSFERLARHLRELHEGREPGHAEKKMRKLVEGILEDGKRHQGGLKAQLEQHKLNYGV